MIFDRTPRSRLFCYVLCFAVLWSLTEATKKETCRKPQIQCNLDHQVHLVLSIKEHSARVNIGRTECCARKVYSGFNTVFLSLLLLAAGVGFPAACFWR